MSVIIRLQNLPWSANALDIRQFFNGLSIPEGGVHIVGGELGDAFIAFSTDEDARQAFQRNNGNIKSVQITLSLSSRTEMQRVIEAARSQTYSAFMQASPPAPSIMPAAVPCAVPAAVPEIKQDISKDNKNDKKERERKRSRSRERRDRSRDRRDRRYRERSRSRSRDRRRRRERSRSRDRSRSRERRSRDSSRRRSNEKVIVKEQRKIEPWAQNEPIIQQPLVTPGLIANNFVNNLEELRRNLNVINPALTGNNFQAALSLNRGRESWPQTNLPHLKNQNIFQQRPSDENFTNEPRNFQSKMESMNFDRNNRRNIFAKVNNSKPMEPESRNQFERAPAPNCCVRIKPFYGAYGDLRRFFHGCFISNKGIKFINDKSGSRTGIVYVQFGNPESKVEALARNNENMNGINISITHIDDKEFEASVDRFLPKKDEEEEFRPSRTFSGKTKFFNRSDKSIETLKVFTCLTVEDLPTYVKEQDILKMFSHYPLTSIIIPPRSRDSYIAYARFSNADDAKKALSETQLHVIEGKAVTVRACKDEDFEKVNQEHDVKITPPNVQRKIDTDCLRLSGLPLKTNDRDIADFFSDIAVIPKKIHLINNNFGGFTGEAFCEFETLEDAEKAYSKNSSYLGTELISVTPVKRKNMEESLGIKPSPDVKVVIKSDQVISSPEDLEMKILNSVQHNERMTEFQPDNSQIPFYPENNTPRPFQNSRNNFEGNGRGRGGFGGRGGRGSRFGPPVGMRNNMSQEVPPGCTVYMDNIPYKAGTNDILDFFEGYNVANNVSRRFNPNNTPTAEAKVVFRTPEEAFVAVRDKNMQNIWDRPIYLRQV
ncbi:uncharacterized protein LOC123672798 [Harmonia axyridis]|uniref:uncharacterized protein LOC123672798 n=1 Tax=Harmonia axyridis TaxID=115357 RepID=UPI001E277A6A|nr:uncharacterized protein LOC123672798 [Harmonia axyridis]